MYLTRGLSHVIAHVFTRPTLCEAPAQWEREAGVMYAWIVEGYQGTVIHIYIYILEGYRGERRGFEYRPRFWRKKGASIYLVGRPWGWNSPRKDVVGFG